MALLDCCRNMCMIVLSWQTHVRLGMQLTELSEAQ